MEQRRAPISRIRYVAVSVATTERVKKWDRLEARSASRRRSSSRSRGLSPTSCILLLFLITAAAEVFKKQEVVNPADRAEIVPGLV